HARVAVEELALARQDADRSRGADAGRGQRGVRPRREARVSGPVGWPAALILENGRIFRGRGFGARVESIGEVVFNTSITGYQEIVSDPSYAGQIVVMTATQIGNVGVNRADTETRKIACAGL